MGFYFTPGEYEILEQSITAGSKFELKVKSATSCSNPIKVKAGSLKNCLFKVQGKNAGIGDSATVTTKWREVGKVTFAHGTEVKRTS